MLAQMSDQVATVEPNSRVVSPQSPRIGRRVLSIRDWNEICDFMHLQPGQLRLEELLQDLECKRQHSRGQWNTSRPIMTAADEDSCTTQTYPLPDKWDFSLQQACNC